MSDTQDQFNIWRREMRARRDAGFVATIDKPQSDEHLRDVSTDVGVSGYWRVMAARTKVNWPVMIVDRDGTSYVQWGGGEPRPWGTEKRPNEYAEFRAETFMHCAAVTKDEWQSALDTGLWADGLYAINPPSAEEKHAPGGNLAGAEDDEARDAYAAELAEKLDPLVKDAEGIRVTDQASAERAAKLRDDIAEIWKVAEKTRKVQKEPVDKAAAVIQNRFSFLKRAADAGAAALDKVEAWKRAEQRRREDEARWKRAADAEAARIAEEQRLRDEATKAGQIVNEEDIAAQAEEKAAEVASAPVEPIAAPVVRGAATARAATKARVKTGRILDAKVFAGFLIDQGDEELMSALQRRANAAARAGIKMQGMEID